MADWAGARAQSLPRQRFWHYLHAALFNDSGAGWPRRLRFFTHYPSSSKRHLNARGLSDKGTKQEMCERCVASLERQADLIGYGELSAFGEKCVREIFKRVNHDGGSLTFEGFATMARLIGVAPPSDERDVCC